jgi:hypothetical protein
MICMAAYLTSTDKLHERLYPPHTTPSGSRRPDRGALPVGLHPASSAGSSGIARPHAWGTNAPFDPFCEATSYAAGNGVRSVGSPDPRTISRTGTTAAMPKRPPRHLEPLRLPWRLMLVAAAPDDQRRAHHDPAHHDPAHHDPAHHDPAHHDRAGDDQDRAAHPPRRPASTRLGRDRRRAPARHWPAVPAAGAPATTWRDPRQAAGRQAPSPPSLSRRTTRDPRSQGFPLNRRSLEGPTARSVGWCSTSVWSAPDGSGLLRLDAPSVQTDREGSCWIVWMINRMIKQVRRPGSRWSPRDLHRSLQITGEPVRCHVLALLLVGPSCPGHKDRPRQRSEPGQEGASA